MSEDWKPGSFGCHEALDRVSLIVEMLDRFILEHPSIVAVHEWQQLAETGFHSLRMLYQEIAKAHIPFEDEGK